MTKMSALESLQPIGVFVHAFYEDVTEEIASYLINIPLPFRVYVSTDSEDKKSVIEASFRNHNLSAQLDIKILPSQGRDFGPFIMGFREEIGRHEICLRLHTKKSSHAPPEWGMTWRRYLL